MDDLVPSQRMIGMSNETYSSKRGFLAFLGSAAAFAFPVWMGLMGPLRYDGGVAGHRFRCSSRTLLLTSLSCTGLDLGDLNPLLRIICAFDVVVTWTPAATVSVPLGGCMESAGRPRPYFSRDFRGLVHSGCGTIRLRLLAHACIAGRPFSGNSWG